MKALVLEAYKTLVYKDVPDPSPGPDEVKVRIRSAGICGSDVHGYDGSSGRRVPPVIMGHEAAGVIEETGRDVKNWEKGDRVTFDSTIYNPDDWFARQGRYNLSDNRRVLGVSHNEYKQDGAFAEYITLPAHILYRIPEGVSFDEASLTEPISVALHAVNLSQSTPDDKAVVVGSGIIGLMIIQVLRARGYEHIVAVDIDPYKLQIAGQLGASATINPVIDDLEDIVEKQTGFKRMDVVFEAVGIQKSIDHAFDSIRKGGTVVLVGNVTANVQMPLQKIVTQELRVLGSCAICGEYPEALELLKNNMIDTGVLITQTSHLSDGSRWFEKLYNKEDGLLKVILNP